MNSSETSTAVAAVDPFEDRLWTTRQVAEFLRVCPKTVFNLRRVGLPYVQLGKTVRYIPQRVKDYLAANPNLSFHRLRQMARQKPKSL